MAKKASGNRAQGRPLEAEGTHRGRRTTRCGATTRLSRPPLRVPGRGTQLRPVAAVDDLHAMLKSQGDWRTSAAPTSRSRRTRAPVEAGRQQARRPVGRLVRTRRGCAAASASTCPAERGRSSGRGRAQREEQPDEGYIAATRALRATPRRLLFLIRASGADAPGCGRASRPSAREG